MQNYSCKERNCIFETLSRIDQMQKEALIEKECDNCEGGLMFKIFNTKPISVFLCNGETFKAELPGPQSCDTPFFRVQELKGDCVVLRLIEKNGATFHCTKATVTLKISCICAIQCFDPICCEDCSRHHCPRI